MKAPRGDRIPAHMHLKTHEIFYVVDGEISVWMDDQADYHSKTTLDDGRLRLRAGRTSCTRSRSRTRRRCSVSAPPGSSGSSTRSVRRPTSTEPQGVYVPDFRVLRAAGEKYWTQFMPEFQFRD